MNNLLFTALLIILIYYFFYYLPSQKKLNTANPPLKHNRETQTNPTQTVIKRDEKELEELKLKSQELTKENKDYQQKVKQKDSQITTLQTQIRELVKRPAQPTNHKSIQTDSETELTNTLDTLIKDIQNLNNSLN